MENPNPGFNPAEVTILLVDDSPMNLKFLQHALSKEGFATECANSGQETLEKLSEREYDLILLDIMMPLLDGYAVLGKLRSDERTKDIPVIFLTAMSDPNIKEKGFNLGVNDFITKPFKSGELISRVNAQLQMKFQNERIRKEEEALARQLEKSARILLVDDSPMNLNLLEATLRQRGYATESANSGQEALEKLSQKQFDLILLDIMMPVLDGYAVVGRLRSDPKTKDIPVIFLTAMSDPNVKAKGLNLGANDFVTKPFNPSELIARVNTQLRLRFQNEQIRKQHEEITRSHGMLLKDLSSAQRIQKALLPKEYPKSEALSFAAEYIPCAHVGGDLYDVFRIDNEHLGIYICDVSGHGVPAAMITVFIKQSFSSYLSQTPYPARLSPRNAMESINFAYMEEDFGDYYVTIFYAVINEKTLEMTYTCAGHNGRPFLLSADNGVQEIGHNAVAVGWFTEPNFIQDKIQLKEKDRIVFYTDGIFEALNAEDEMWGSERFMKFALDHYGRASKYFCVKLLKTIEEFSGKNEHDDDIALLLVDVL